jgi:hypothetical protein
MRTETCDERDPAQIRRAVARRDATKLHRVRSQLDYLCDERAIVGLTDDQDLIYQQLCRVEVSLIGRCMRSRVKVDKLPVGTLPGGVAWN